MKGLNIVQHKILLVEDDISIANMLAEHIEKYGYKCVIAEDFNNILNIFIEEKPHVVLLDINLPKYDGYYWCRKIRQISNQPIILISARNSESEQVMGIESGADDYITKPFYFDVVLAKIKSQIRRIYGEYSQENETQILTKGNTSLNLNTLRLSTSTHEEVLTVTELKLCHELFENYPQVSTRQQLFSAIWSEENFVEENTLTVNVRRLRQKLKAIQSSLSIETVRGMGYQLVVENK